MYFHYSVYLCIYEIVQSRAINSVLQIQFMTYTRTNTVKWKKTSEPL